MTVYVLSVVWQCDSGECGNDITVYSTIEKANKAFLQEIENAKQDFSGMEVETTPLATGDMSWSIWEKDEYCYNHIDITIYQREMQ